MSKTLWEIKLKKWEIFLTESIIGKLLDEFNYEKSKISLDEKIIDKSASEVVKSKLVSEGLIKFLISGKGMERYPTDPTDKRNWAKTPERRGRRENL